MKKRIIVLSVLVFILTCCFGLWKLNKDFLLLSNANSINVEAEDSLSTDKVKIEFGISVNTISRSTDLELFKRREKYTVLFDGQAKEQMINDYGENDFLITYDNQYYFSFRQFKFSQRHQHDYSFCFLKRGRKIVLRANIKGKDAMRFERPMLEITNAEKYSCNVPVDSAGIMYNMIELVKPCGK